MNIVIKLPIDLAVDENGLLKNAVDWDEAVAVMMAHDLGIKSLTADHWRVIFALRKHYELFGSAPAMFNICHTYGHEPDWVHNLFQSCLNAWRIAGLADPGEEAKAYLNNM